MPEPFVSIITINYNQTKVTGELLESLCNLRWSNYEVIVVDNGSEENPGHILSSRYPDVKFVESGENLGFSGGNNLGMRMAGGDYFFLINNDTEIHPDAITHLYKAFTEYDHMGMACPKIRYFDQPDIIQYAGYSKMNPYTARNETLGQFESDNGQWDQGASTWFAHGAAMFTSREVVKKIGLMPEIYFLYYEELDWSAAIRRAGLQIRFVPLALVMHKESISVGKLSTLKTYYVNRNRILFMRRNSALFSLIVFSCYWIFVVAPKNMILFLFTGQWKHFSAFVRAMFWNFSHRKGGQGATL